MSSVPPLILGHRQGFTRQISPRQADATSEGDLDVICLVLSPSGTVLSSNPAAKGLSDWQGGTLESLADLTHPHSRAAVQKIVKTAVSRGRSACTVQARGSREGTLRHLQLLLTRLENSPIPGADTSAVAVAVQGWDITSLIFSQPEPAESPSQESLTGVESRSAFTARLNDNLIHRWGAQRVALLVAHVGEPDSNDRHHSVLAEVAARLLAALRPGDTLGRISADEFGLICHSITGWSDLSVVLDRLRAVALAPIHLPDGDLQITLSIGAVFTDETVNGGHAAEDLLAQAGRYMSPD